jgi:DNA gyrase subunit A
VRGVRLANEQDEVVGMICLENEIYDILVVSENGYGKRSKLEDYRVTNRGGKGVKTLNITPKTGNLISILNVLDLNDLMIINKSGIAIRMAVANLRVMGRATQGVRLIDLRDDSIAAVTKIEVDEDEIIDESEEPITENSPVQETNYSIANDDIADELIKNQPDEDDLEDDKNIETDEEN